MNLPWLVNWASRRRVDRATRDGAMIRDSAQALANADSPLSDDDRRVIVRDNRPRCPSHRPQSRVGCSIGPGKAVEIEWLTKDRPESPARSARNDHREPQPTGRRTSLEDADRGPSTRGSGDSANRLRIGSRSAPKDPSQSRFAVESQGLGSDLSRHDRSVFLNLRSDEKTAFSVLDSWLLSRRRSGPNRVPASLRSGEERE